MNIIDIITKKRDGLKLSKDEIYYFVENYTKDLIPDYQASAFLMAIYLKGLDNDETFFLTDAMKSSGDIIDLSTISGIKVDKHSTGGVGDKTTLIIASIVASLGVPVAKMSGRGLGFAGGTVDKMEAIPNFKINLTSEEFINQVKEIGISVIGQTSKIAYADKKIYALRDVTATIDSLPLIASSIMSKKLASGGDKILLDVKCGSGAFMTSPQNAIELAKIMCDLGKKSAKQTVAIVTDMNQPLGNAVGNAIEIKEVIDTLKGKGPSDITQLCLQLASIMVFLGEKSKSPEMAYPLVEETLYSGKALEKFKEFIAKQGGNTNIIENYSLLENYSHSLDFISPSEGYITSINSKLIGMASQITGAGRKIKEDKIDLYAGIYLNHKINSYVKKGDSLLTLYGNDQNKLKEAYKILENAYKFSNKKIELPPLIIEKIGLN